MLLAIDHVQIAMPRGQEDAARAFYAGLLGMGEVPKPRNLAGRGGAWFRHGQVQVHLGVEDDFRPALKAHPAFIVDDLDDLTRRAVEAGFRLDESQPPIDGYARAHLFDPFGNRIEFMQRTNSS